MLQQVNNGVERPMNEIVTLLSLFLPILLSLVMVWRLERKISFFEDLGVSIGQLFRYETQKDDEGNEQVMMDPRLLGIVDALGSRVAKSLKMSFLGQLSGNSRLQKGLKGAITQDFVEKKAPILNLVGDVLGFNTADYITDHPDAIMQLLPMLGKFMGNSGHNSPGAGSVGYPK